MAVSGFLVVGIIGIAVIAAIVSTLILLVGRAFPRVNEVSPVDLQNPAVAVLIGLVVALGIVVFNPGTLTDLLNFLLF